MKRIFCLIIVMVLFLTACGESEAVSQPETETVKEDFSYGAWLSFYEINDMLSHASGFETEFEKLLTNLKNLKINNLYIHIRPNGDSLFESEYFPLMENAKKYDYDIFEFMLKKCHNRGIKVHAWINPYRISASSTDIDALPQDSMAKKWYLEGGEKGRNVIVYDGIYLNPAESDSRRLVVDGVRETLEKYDIDGIHFDDYFYPTTNSDFDKDSYEIYRKSAENPLPLADWRRANVDALISDCKTAIEMSEKDVIFSISPAADIAKNHNEFYADIKGWVKNGLVDEIIPQLYFGFNHTNSDFKFEKLLEEWKDLCKVNKNVKLIIGLAPYKIGLVSQYDGEEWNKEKAIIARQTEICIKDDTVSGVIFFSCGSLFSEKSQNLAEREALAEVLEEY